MINFLDSAGAVFLGDHFWKFYLFHEILHDSALDASAYTADSVGNKLGIVPEILLTVYAYRVPICVKSHESSGISKGIT